MKDAPHFPPWRIGAWVWLALQVVACAAPRASDAASAPAGFGYATFAKARSVGLAGGTDGDLYVVLGRNDRLFLARSTDGGRSFDTPSRINPDAPAVVSPFERPPATAAGQAVGVAWLSRDAGPGTSVRYASSRDLGRRFGPSSPVSRSDEPETTMVQTAPGTPLAPAVAWLQNGKLMLARSRDAGATFPTVRVVDGQVCECCQPAVAVAGQRLLIAYRNLERDRQGREIRDLYVAASEDGGVTFSKGEPVSDAHWYLDACPVSAPALAREDGRLLVLWMDGRNDPGGLRRSDIWLAASSDGGKSFSANRRINPAGPGYRRWPDMAVDGEGRVHVVWVTATPRGETLYYTWSDDGGGGFAPPRPLLRSPAQRRSGTIASVSLTALPSGRIVLAWVDNLGAHIGAWPTGEPPRGLTP